MEKWKFDSRCSGSTVFRRPGHPKMMLFGTISDSRYWVSLLSHFLRIWGPFWHPFGMPWHLIFLSIFGHFFRSHLPRTSHALATHLARTSHAGPSSKLVPFSPLSSSPPLKSLRLRTRTSSSHYVRGFPELVLCLGYYSYVWDISLMSGILFLCLGY